MENQRERHRGSRRTTARGVRIAFLTLAAGLFLIQLVPYRTSNPPARHEPPWDSPQTRDLAVRACFDCHSNQTRSRWYAKVAPISWWTTSHVREGRSALNFSEWDRQQGDEDIAGTVADGTMPPSYYTWLGLNKDAQLTPAERQALIAGLRALKPQGQGQGRD